MVATISRFRDAITTLFSHSNKIPFQKQHNTSKRKLLVNKTLVHFCNFTKSNAHILNASNNSFTITAEVNNCNSKFNSNINCHANHLLKINTASAPQIQPLKSKIKSKSENH